MCMIKEELETRTCTITSKTAYLLGVEKKHFESEYGTLQIEIFKKLEQDSDARIIRNLCRLRTDIEQNFSILNAQMRCGLKNLQSFPGLIPQESLRQLEADGMNIVKPNCKLSQYIININKLICDHIGCCKKLYPDWIEWRYIRELFVMPNGQTEDGIRKAAKEYYANRNRCPYQVYINWAHGDDGNILYNDEKFLTLMYHKHGDTFCDLDRVTDASSAARDGIRDFLEKNSNTVILIDCENADPYKVCAVMPALEAQAPDRIGKIVLCDDIHTSSAWDILESHTKIPVEHYLARRINENKSIVDQSLCVKACQEYYENHADGILLFGSDSDYWGLFGLLRTVNYYVMVESSKFGINHQQALEKAGIPYCCIDSFCEGSSQIKAEVMLKEVRTALQGALQLNIGDVLHNAYLTTRAKMSKLEQKQFYDRYIKPMRLVIGDNGDLSIVTG